MKCKKKRQQQKALPASVIILMQLAALEEILENAEREVNRYGTMETNKKSVY